MCGFSLSCSLVLSLHHTLATSLLGHLCSSSNLLLAEPLYSVPWPILHLLAIWAFGKCAHVNFVQKSGKRAPSTRLSRLWVSCGECQIFNSKLVPPASPLLCCPKTLHVLQAHTCLLFIPTCGQRGPQNKRRHWGILAEEKKKELRPLGRLYATSPASPTPPTYTCCFKHLARLTPPCHLLLRWGASVLWSGEMRDLGGQWRGSSLVKRWSFSRSFVWSAGKD